MPFSLGSYRSSPQFGFPQHVVALGHLFGNDLDYLSGLHRVEEVAGH